MSNNKQYIVLNKGLGWWTGATNEITGNPIWTSIKKAAKLLTSNEAAKLKSLSWFKEYNLKLDTISN